MLEGLVRWSRIPSCGKMAARISDGGSNQLVSHRKSLQATPEDGSAALGPLVEEPLCNVWIVWQTEGVVSRAAMRVVLIDLI